VAEPDFLRSTRVSYDLLAEHVADAWRGELAVKPFDRAALAVFAELVRGELSGLVTDIGCGAGRITAFLHAAGLDAEGIDLSPGMLAAAKRDYPGLRFTEGDMLRLNLPDESRAGIVAWYSIIHLPREPVREEKTPQAFILARKPGPA
jgi:SAM-dependent methyltransferase